MLISYLRTLILYLLLIITVRLMGKRQIGQMEPSEFVVTMLLANLAAVPMQDNGVPLLNGMVPILTVLAAELVLSVLSLKSIRLRRALCGKPVILVENGNICKRNLDRTRIHLDELTEHLRQQGVLDLSTVQYVILETNGQLSIFRHAKYQPASARDAGIQVEDDLLPYTIVSDGHLLQDNLRLSGHSRAWLRRQLDRRGARIADTLLFTVDPAGKIYFTRKEDAK